MDDPEEVEIWRAEYAACVATFKKFHDIREQYKANGYAMLEVEANDE
jgi:hypothetical protein